MSPKLAIKLLCVFIFAQAVWTTAGWARDDFQYRSLYTFKLIDTKKFDFVLFNQFRMIHDAEDVNYYAISPQMKFDLWKNLGLGFNYTYLNVKIHNETAQRSEYKFHHRVELEVNPRWKIRESIEMQLRNRYEFRWIEDQGAYNPRLRDRLNIEFPLKNVLPVQAVYINTEFFYDMSDHRFNENWTTPLGVKFKVTDNSSLSVFYLIQSKLTEEWTTSHALGTNVFVRF